MAWSTGRVEIRNPFLIESPGRAAPAADRWWMTRWSATERSVATTRRTHRGLAAIGMPMAQMGADAAATLLCAIDGAPLQHRVVRARPVLVPRGSVSGPGDRADGR